MRKLSTVALMEILLSFLLIGCNKENNGLQTRQAPTVNDTQKKS